MQTIAERINDIVTAEHVAHRTRFLSENVEELVTSMIPDIGVPAHVKSYQYLCESILMTIDDMEVMRAIRHAIELA